MPVGAPILRSFKAARFAVLIRPESELLLPRYKGGVFRGGFGYAFRSVVCPSHEVDCVISRLGRPCIYSEVFQTPVPADSRVMRKYPYAPHPFVLVPPISQKTRFSRAEQLRLELVLIGRAIPWLGYFIVTLEELGRRGIGANRSRCKVEAVCSLGPGRTCEVDEGRLIYDPQSREVVGVPITIQEDVLVGSDCGREEVTLTFVTPLRIVQDCHLSGALSFSTLVRALLRRLALLAYFHCGEMVESAWIRQMIAAAEAVQVKHAALRWHDWERYSTRQKTSMKLGGLLGRVTYAGKLGPFVPYLRAGEVVHVGKGTSFGLGRYVLEEG